MEWNLSGISPENNGHVWLKESLNGNIVVFLFKKTQIKDK